LDLKHRCWFSPILKKQQHTRLGKLAVRWLLVLSAFGF